MRSTAIQVNMKHCTMCLKCQIEKFLLVFYLTDITELRDLCVTGLKGGRGWIGQLKLLSKSGFQVNFFTQKDQYFLKHNNFSI